MRFHILAVGRLREPYFEAAAREYEKRLRPYARVERMHVADDAQLLAAVPAGATLVALEPSGTPLSSERFAAWLEATALEGRSTFAFAIGGADGLSQGVRERAELLLSLSAMTLPHQLALVVLVEQLYRAMRIIRGEPYHR